MNDDLEKIFNILESTLEKNKTNLKDNEELIDAYNLWFNNVRYYNTKWNNLFNSRMEKYLINKNKNIKSVLNEVFSLSFELSEMHYNLVRRIYNTRETPSFYFNRNSNIEPLYFLINYRNHIMIKNYSSCIYHFLKFINFKIKNNKTIFDEIKKYSLSGKIISEQNNTHYFHIPSNKAPSFLFFDNNKIIGIDVFIDHKYMIKDIISHFILMHLSFNKNYDILKNNLIENSKKDFNELISPFLKNKNKLDVFKIKNFLQSNCNYVVCFDTDEEYSCLEKEKLNTYKFLSMEYNIIDDIFFDNDFYKILFNQISHSKNKNNLTFMREYCLSFLINSIKNDNYNCFLNSLNYSDKNFLEKSLGQKCNFIKIIFEKTQMTYDDFTAASKKSGIINESEIDFIYNLFIDFYKFKDFKENNFLSKSIFSLKNLVVKGYSNEIIYNGLINNDDYEKIIDLLKISNPKLSKRKIKSKLDQIKKYIHNA